MKKIFLISVGVIVSLIVYQLGNQIYTSFKAGDKLTSSLDKLHGLEVKNKELKSKLKQIKSPEYVEKVARDKLGLAREGETVVVIPQEKIEAVLGTKKGEEPRLPNPLGWLKVFFK